jgi:hypothetical protein
MYVPHGVTQVARGGWPHRPFVRTYFLLMLFQLFSVFCSGFGTRRTRWVVSSVPSGSDQNQFQFLTVHRAPMLESKPCNQGVARTRTLCCSLPNRATKVLLEPEPFVAAFQTVQLSSCKKQNPLLQAFFWAHKSLILSQQTTSTTLLFQKRQKRQGPPLFCTLVR